MFRRGVADVFLLVSLQLGIAALAGMAVSVLPMGNSSSWVGGLGAFLGAQSFALLREGESPGWKLALASSFLQTAAGILVLAFFLWDSASRRPVDPRLILLLAAPLGFAVNFGLTLLGFRMGRRPGPTTL